MDGRAAKADGMMDGKGERASSWTNRSGLSSMLEIHPTLHHPCGCVFHPASIHPEPTLSLSLSLSAPPCPQFWSFIMHPFLSFSSLSLSLSLSRSLACHNLIAVLLRLPLQCCRQQATNFFGSLATVSRTERPTLFARASAFHVAINPSFKSTQNMPGPSRPRPPIGMTDCFS